MKLVEAFHQYEPKIPPGGMRKGPSPLRDRAIVVYGQHWYEPTRGVFGAWENRTHDEPRVGVIAKTKIKAAVRYAAGDPVVNDIEGVPAADFERIHTQFVMCAREQRMDATLGIYDVPGFVYPGWGKSETRKAHDEALRFIDRLCRPLLYDFVCPDVYVTDGYLEQRLDRVAFYVERGVDVRPFVSLSESNPTDAQIMRAVQGCRERGVTVLHRWEARELPVDAEYLRREAVLIEAAAA